MFGPIPERCIHAHDWRGGVSRVGSIPAEKVREATRGKADWGIHLDLNSMLVGEKWDLVVNIGHVVPHEGNGSANRNKNHLSASAAKKRSARLIVRPFSTASRIISHLANFITPLRACYNRAQQEFLGHLPDLFLQLVMGRDGTGCLVHSRFFAGDDLETYFMAACRSRE